MGGRALEERTSVGGFRRRHLVLLRVVRFGLKHRFVWGVLPFVLIAVGALGLGQLSDHYAWGGGTTLLIGLLALCLFVVTVGPLTLLPATLVRAERKPATASGPLDLMEALRRSVA